MIGNFGVLAQGFVPKRVTDIVSQIQASLAGAFGAGFLFDSTTPEASLLQTFALQIADVWEENEQTYNNGYPDTASGTSLDMTRGSLSNVPRIPQTFSVVNGVVLTGTPLTAIPNTLQLSVAGNSSAIFTISGATTIGAGGTVTASFVSTTPGPIQAAATLLSTIVTPVVGLTSASNPTAAQVGTFAETDAAYRLRAAQQLNAPGGSTFAGFALAVQNVPNVSLVFPYSNDTSLVDANGLAPNSILAIVVGGVDQDIADALFAAKAGGIKTNGTTNLTVIDLQGNSHTCSFSRVIGEPIYLAVALTINTNPALGPIFPTNGTALVQAAILNFGSTFQPGQEVTSFGIQGSFANIPGIVSAAILMGTTYPPLSAGPITLAIDHQATFASANVVVTT